MGKVELLTDLAKRVHMAAGRGMFGGKIRIRDAVVIPGPRAGAVEFDAGFDADKLLKGLSASKQAKVRQLFLWEFPGHPQVFMSGRFVRLEAGWPKGMWNTDVRLGQINHRAGDGRWIVGVSENGSTISAGLNDNTPHWLVAGTSGSGKTTAVESAVSQLSSDPANRLVLIDIAKGGASFKGTEHVPGRAGPLVRDVSGARDAMAWCVQEMQRRYNVGWEGGRLIIVIDEVQAITEDEACTAMLEAIVTKGRDAHVHALVATQHPLVKNLGGSTVKNNLAGHLALRVTSAKASEVAVGDTFPHAQHLMGCGDGYVVVSGLSHRVQVAYEDREIPTGPAELDEWPEIGEVPEVRGWPTPPEMALALRTALAGSGRTVLQAAAEEHNLQIADNNRASNLVRLGRETIEWSEEHLEEVVEWKT